MSVAPAKLARLLTLANLPTTRLLMAQARTQLAHAGTWHFILTGLGQVSEKGKRGKEEREGGKGRGGGRGEGEEGGKERKIERERKGGEEEREERDG